MFKVGPTLFDTLFATRLSQKHPDLGFLVDGIDISYLYEPSTGGDQLIDNTGFKINGEYGTDLKFLFRAKDYIAPTVPTITAQPNSSQTIYNVGNYVVISAAATGIPAPTYQWLRNGSNIAFATSPTLAFNATMADAAAFSIKVTNSQGVVYSNSLTLTIQYAPTITLQPSATQVAHGGSAVLLISAHSIPAPQYQWQFNGVSIGGATSSNYVVSNATQASAGSYRCIVYNVVGTVYSSSASVTVIDPPTITGGTIVSNWSIQQGSYLSYNVSVSGTAPFSYAWYKNGSLLTAYTTSTGPAFSPAAPGDSGLYSVTVSNSVGNSSASSQLSVTTTLIVSADAGFASITPAAGAHYYASSDNPTITATPGSFYDFARFEVDGVHVFANPTSVSMTTNHTVVAVSALKNVGFSISVGGGNGSAYSNTGSPCPILTTVGVIATPDEGFELDVVSADNSAVVSGTNVTLYGSGTTNITVYFRAI
jgi:hypothetical protein